MMRYKSTSINSKWTKTKWLLKHSELSDNVPHTLQFNKSNLNTMLSKYETVFFKPTVGSGGARIIRIRKLSSGYQTHYNTTKVNYSTLNSLYNKLNRFSNQRAFLLQKGIQLARTNGKPFDIRVMVQKTNSGEWKSTAIFMKIGKPGKVATNYNQGGKIGFLQPTLSGAGFDTTSTEQMEQQLQQMGVAVGGQFDRYLKGFRELGLDVALDANKKPWILEVNTRPQIYPLKHMRDRTMYKKILSYAKQYGRTK
ncbi:MAG: YheC/YheD family protein [Candidatus Cohnella colombiensis]|uniref:YheC/YheD family protein n=1 Tax=Candidatus Cohnella colombiensis TaxID=3121368 RepID=A0AA95JGJ6_9BACL|nr:MAG: YheC/YheD family protein [Cohnella sp.]